MKINNLKINNYGKLQNKELTFNDNINIIYGENEAGKSTLLDFILSMLYGASKNKNGKEFSNFDKFLPWNSGDFSGKINYSLDNNTSFEVFRDFTKKNPKIFNEQMEDISKNFNIDKTKGSQFFFDQTKMDENLFLSSLVVSQEQVKLDKNDQSALIQKITNLVGTGEDNVSFTKAFDVLQKKQLNEYGSPTSKQKPINIISKKIDELNREIFEIKQIDSMKNSINNKLISLNSEISELRIKIDFLTEYKLVLESSRIQKEKIVAQQSILDSNNIRQEELKKRKSELMLSKDDLEYKKSNNDNLYINITKSNNVKFGITSVLIIILNIIQLIFITNITFTVIGFSIFVLYIIISKLLSKKRIATINSTLEHITKSINTLDMELLAINKEFDLIEGNNLGVYADIDKLNHSIEIDLANKINELKNSYKNKFNYDNFRLFLDKITTTDSLKDISNGILTLENIFSSKSLELHKCGLEKENLSKNIRNLTSVEEDLNMCLLQKNNIENLNTTIEYAKVYLKNAYEQMKNTISPKFTKNLSTISSCITNGKYSSIKYSDDLGLIVELDNGNYEPISKLSVGTIDQLYLSLRLSMAKDFTSENMPIILDETFAYYDKSRLSNILDFISTNFENHQVLIFTCTKREESILTENNIKYSLIKL